MSLRLLKYGLICCLLLSILESNGIPVLSFFGKAVYEAQKSDNANAEDPAQESSENVRAETVKPWLHQLTIYNFTQPVLWLSVKQLVRPIGNFPFAFYPDVLTPPPNC